MNQPSRMCGSSTSGKSSVKYWLTGSSVGDSTSDFIREVKIELFKYVIKRLLLLIFVVIGITLFIYLILSAAPGDPAQLILGMDATGRYRCFTRS